MSLWQPLSDAQILSLPILKNGATALISSFQMAMPFECQLLIRVEEQAIHVSIRPEEFIKDESGDIEGTISDSVYLGLNTEYFIETGFASKI
ncbi:ABC transporter ATP-binding protein [Streptococcus pneumoniae]|nr:ABC transporter ATP-binding protein [Streptococcus pneumoniae]